MIKSFVHKLWNFEIDEENAGKLTFVPAVIIFATIIYILVELLFMAPDSNLINLSQFSAFANQEIPVNNSFSFTSEYFPIAWIALIGFTFSFRLFISVHGYFFNSKVENKGLFYRNLLVYASSGLLTIIFSLLILVAAGLIYLALGYNFSDGMQFLSSIEHNISGWINLYIPTLIKIPYKIPVLIVAFSLYSLTAYFLHWLTHVSRFMWHVVHAPHHLPDYLHPLGAPLAYTFDFFLLLPKVLSAGIITKLFYTEPLILETALLALFFYNFEIFNHSAVHYKLARKNKFIHFMSQLTGGGGAYHFLHHSTAQEHQMANIGGGLFMIWDRLFGTFVEPSETRPTTGWTNGPATHMNPLRVILGGPAKILYELKHNKNWKTRLLIIFGNIEYVPPCTKEFIKKSACTDYESIAVVK
jgi:sterol desaturase/sphingolipid hydroxylase (fatty acid hydroxylase superfamily)